jgi:hypothetical protein
LVQVVSWWSKSVGKWCRGDQSGQQEETQRKPMDQKHHHRYFRIDTVIGGDSVAIHIFFRHESFVRSSADSQAKVPIFLFYPNRGSPGAAFFSIDSFLLC